MKTKLDPQVFRDAMRHIENVGFGCCWALHKSLDMFETTEATYLMVDLLGVPNSSIGAFWYPLNKRGYTSRIIALELCALMLEDEQKKIKKKSRGKKAGEDRIDKAAASA